MPLIDRGSAFGNRVMDRLTHEEVIWLTTVRADGQALPVPVWFLWDGDEELFIYSQPNQLKLRNIEAHPRVTLNFNSDENGNDVARFEAEARIDPSLSPPAEVSALIDKYRVGAERMGATPEGVWDGYSVPIRVRLTKLWGFLD